MTPQEALARIAALCDQGDRDDFQAITTRHLRALLAEVSPEPGVTLDRDMARETLSVLLAGREIPDAVLDLLAACVRPTEVTQ